MALQTKDFSVTGKSSGGGITYTYILRVTQNSTNAAANTSNLTVQAILKQSYSGTAFHTWYTGVSCALNGSQIFSDYVQRSLSGTGEHVYYNWTGDVAHKADGTLTLSVEGAFWQSTYESYSPPAMNIRGGTMTLTAIPRASSLTAVDANIGEATNITIRAAANGFRHSLAYRFGNLRGYIKPDGGISQSEVVFDQRTVRWQIPTNFYYQIPDAKWGACTLTCRTYSGSTQVGSDQSTSFRAVAAMGNCSPVLTADVEDVNQQTLALTGDPFMLIRYHSTARCTAKVNGVYGASILINQVNGKTITNSVWDMEKAETDTFTFYAEDSRGWVATQKVQVPMIPYTRLTCDPMVYRTGPTEDTVILELTGSYFPYHFGNQENTLTVTYRINSRDPVQIPVAVEEDGSFSSQMTLEGLSHDTAYTLTVAAEDLLERVSVKLPVRKGLPLFNWNETGFEFHVPVRCNSSVSGAYLRPVEMQGVRSFRFRSRFSAWDQSGRRQSVLLTGNRGAGAVLGVILIGGKGGAAWSGTEGITVSTQAEGTVTVDMGENCYDPLLLMSPDFIEIL